MKKWEAPKLIVLVRSRPEESLNNICKHWRVNPTGPNAAATACYSNAAACLECVSYSAS